MKTLSPLSKTLFIPLLGRIAISETLPDLYYDKKAMEIADKVKQIAPNLEMSQYGQIAQCYKSMDIDERVQDFIKYNRDGIVVDVGCGFATAYYRQNLKPIAWYALDLPEVLEVRKEIFGPEEVIYLPFDMFDFTWIDQIKENHFNAPILFVCEGIFHYFEYEKVITFLKMLQSRFRNCQVIFDAFSPLGAKKASKFNKNIGYESDIIFSIDKIDRLIEDVGGQTQLIEEHSMYEGVQAKGLSIHTKTMNRYIENFNLFKLYQIKLA